MFNKLICAMALLLGSYLAAMEQAKVIYQINESSQNETLVQILLTDSQNLATRNKVSIPLRLAKLIGSLAGLLENPELVETEFPMPNVTLAQWLLITFQLERLPSSAHDDPDALSSTEAIVKDYEKLDSHVMIKLIHALDYLDIPSLLVIALDTVTKSKFGRFTIEEINSLPGLMGNHIILHHLLNLSGPMLVTRHAVCCGGQGHMLSMCLTEDGNFVSGSADETVRVWDMKGTELAACRGHKGGVRSVCVTSNGMIVSCSDDETVRVWDMKGNECAVCRGHEGKVTSVCVTKDDKIVSGSIDRTVRVWDMKGNECAVCRGHAGDVTSVCVTPDSNIVSSSIDRTVRVWDIRGKELAVCWGHQHHVLSVCVTQDGKIVSGSADGTVRVWDIKGHELVVYRGHEGDVTSVCVTNYGRIVSGSWDKTVRIWDLLGNQLAVCRGHRASVTSLCVMNDGMIVSCSQYENEKARLWDISLLARINCMDESQSKAMWELLQSVSRQPAINKEIVWREILEMVDFW